MKEVDYALKRLEIVVDELPSGYLKDCLRIKLFDLRKAVDQGKLELEKRDGEDNV